MADLQNFIVTFRYSTFFKQMFGNYLTQEWLRYYSKTCKVKRDRHNLSRKFKIHIAWITEKKPLDLENKDKMWWLISKPQSL